jgi:hypothetical protein
MEPSSLVCDCAALTAEARNRHFNELVPQLKDLSDGVRELLNGYAFRFVAHAATLALVAQWAAGERVCCPFLDIDMRLEPNRGPLWLTLTGPVGAKELIRANLSAWIDR